MTIEPSSRDKRLAADAVIPWLLSNHPLYHPRDEATIAAAKAVGVALGVDLTTLPAARKRDLEWYRKHLAEKFDLLWCNSHKVEGEKEINQLGRFVFPLVNNGNARRRERITAVHAILVGHTFTKHKYGVDV